jgi:choline dehydrogenase-like flavoprotein
MEVDLEDSAGGFPQIYRSQVCIAGAGIAGLVLATALAAEGVDVHLLEAGGKTLEGRSQQLYNATMLGQQHTGATDGRFRVFGGSSTRWGGQLLPYSADIFQPANGIPSPAWPIGETELKPYYAKVEAVMGVDALPYSADLYQAIGHAAPPLDDGIQLRFSKWAPFGKRNLAQTLGRTASTSGKITVFYHANVTGIVMKQDRGSVEALEVRNYAGRSFRFEAAQFVIAAGTIETSRLLLASQVGSPNVGFGLHDHLSYEAALLTGATRDTMLRRYAPFLNKGTLHTAKLEASPALRERLHLPAVMAHLVIAEPEDSGAGVVRALLRSVQQRESRANLLRNIARLPGASAEVAHLVWSAQVLKRRAVSARAAVALRIDCEQRPRPENRVSIDPREPDVLGLPRAVIDWRVGTEEYATMRRYARFLCASLPKMGIAIEKWKPELDVEDDSAPLENVTDTYHMMGGALMGASEATSVVDTDLRVHGLPNVSIASCAVFPAGGSSNPTFTLMALCFRLARRLRRSL